MKTLLNAAYCVNFDDFETLAQMALPGTGVELVLFSDRPEYMNCLRTQTARFCDMPVTLHGPFLEVEAACPSNSAARRRILDAYDEAFDVYEQFQARSIVMHTNQCACAKGDQGIYRRMVAETIAEIGAMAKQRNIRLTVENVGLDVKDTMIFDQAAFMDLIFSLPEHIGCLIDLGHMIINQWDCLGAIEILGSRIWAYHLHNNDGTRDGHRPLFEPQMRYTPVQVEETLRCMERFSPEADWILEYEPGSHISVDSMKKEMERLLSFTRKA